MDASCEFIVSGIVTGESGVFHVIGRCGDVSIRIGETFATLQDKSNQCRKIRIRVDGIQAYGRGFEQLGPGMTGTLDVSGEGVDSIAPGSVLVAATTNQTQIAQAESVKAGQHA